jgi:putative transposase
VIPLEPDTFYHVYNHGNGNERIFVNSNNYSFFLSQYKTYITPIADSYCYCLMPNHFHFLLKIKSESELITTFSKSGTLEKLISKQFANLFSSYSQAFNKQQSRKGSLFMKNFKRKKISDEQYLKKLVHYIHSNPIESGLCEKLTDWKFSSYNALLSQKQTMLQKAEVLDWFEDEENFIYCHRHPPKETGIEF